MSCSCSQHHSFQLFFLLSLLPLSAVIQTLAFRHSRAHIDAGLDPMLRDIPHFKALTDDINDAHMTHLLDEQPQQQPLPQPLPRQPQPLRQPQPPQPSRSHLFDMDLNESIDGFFGPGILGWSVVNHSKKQRWSAWREKRNQMNNSIHTNITNSSSQADNDQDHTESHSIVSQLPYCNDISILETMSVMKAWSSVLNQPPSFSEFGMISSFFFLLSSFNSSFSFASIST